MESYRERRTKILKDHFPDKYLALNNQPRLKHLHLISFC